MTSRSGPNLRRADRPSPERSMTLSPDGWALLDRLARRLGVDGRSGVVRALLAAGEERLVKVVEGAKEKDR